MIAPPTCPEIPPRFLMHLMDVHKMTLLSAYIYVHSCPPFIESIEGHRLQLRGNKPLSTTES